MTKHECRMTKIVAAATAPRNREKGISEIEGKGAQGSAEQGGSRASFKSATSVVETHSFPKSFAATSQLYLLCRSSRSLHSLSASQPSCLFACHAVARVGGCAFVVKERSFRRGRRNVHTSGMRSPIHYPCDPCHLSRSSLARRRIHGFFSGSLLFRFHSSKAWT